MMKLADAIEWAHRAEPAEVFIASHPRRTQNALWALVEEVERLTALCDEYRGEVEELRRSNEEYAQKACDECDPENYGWVFNRVEGRGACTCMLEAEPFQILLTALETITKAATGEIQIANDDTEGMRWIAGKAMEALHSILPLDYDAPNGTVEETAIIQSALTRARAEGMEEAMMLARAYADNSFPGQEARDALVLLAQDLEQLKIAAAFHDAAKGDQ